MSKPAPPTLRQALSARWNCGEFGSMIPVWLVILINPCPLGSGKSGSPWARMHLLHLSPLAAILEGVRSEMLAGTSFWQALAAASFRGELGSRSLPGVAR